MPGIKKRKGGAGWIGGEGLDEDDFDDGRPPRKILLCPHCIEYNFKNPLHHKILMKGEKPAVDYDQWCSCLACGKTFARHEVKVEGILTDTIEVIDNPHDQGKSIVGLGNKVKKTRSQKERQKLLDRIEEEKDEDIKRELRKGNTVEIIEE
jgi:hypothetical protein